MYLNNPEYVKIGDKSYKINTDFRVAIECNQIALDKTIKDTERSLAIIYKLFGDEGINDTNNYRKLLELGLKYLACGKELEPDDGEEPDMDFVEDMNYIETSFLSDYGIDLSNKEMHWWKFNDLINGLSYSELGNCCVLNRIRELRRCDLSKIKDSKERDKMRKAKEKIALKKFKKENNLTPEQEKSMEELNKLAGL